jgi:hypothetical protein
MQSYFTEPNPSPREIELLACLDFVIKKLAEASVLLHHEGAPVEAVSEYQSAVHVEFYLEHHGIKMGDVWKGIDYPRGFFQK